jgi:predicted porin
LYGLIDEGIAFNSNAKGGRQYFLNPSNLQGDRWGLRGKEDLGDGLYTYFVLEGGLNLNTGALGQGGAEFGRAAYVAIGGKLGQLQVGRQVDSLVDTLGGFTFGGSTFLGGRGQLGGVGGMHPADLDNLDNTDRVNNEIKYISPLYNGLQLESTYSLGGVPGSFSQNQIWSLAATYNVGNANFGVAFEQINDPNYSFFGTNPSSSTTANNITTPILSGYASARTQQIAVIGAAYSFGALSTAVDFSSVRFKNLGAVAGTGLNPGGLKGSAVLNTGEVSFGYVISPALTAGAGYTFTSSANPMGFSGARYQQFNVGVDYSVSKRTDFFGLFLFQYARGTDSTLHTAVANVDGFTPSSGPRQTVISMGIRTRF